ncbi:uncharacterized protein LOC121990444 [Zingiber officinale]|uniref:uncharacterized protein LOC121990444 n=1 Tax=Zingiber officinale TaxID=94328 RepID=UPI001C4BD329|nr:uncharacterized protein LOC121990444 [Zingiber officinale]
MMAALRILPPGSPRALLAFSNFFHGISASGWAAAVVLIFLLWKLLFPQRRPPVYGATWPSSTSMRTKICMLITDADLRDLKLNLGGRLGGNEIWEDVIDKRSDLVSYKAKFCRPKNGPLKYFSVATFEKCSTELLRDFYMDNQYRKKWDKILIHHECLQVDEHSGTEVGRSIKKFPILKPREYISAWRMWEGKDKTFYCFTKNCEHPLALRQSKYVRVDFVRSGWRIRKVPGRNSCEITMMHQEDAGINIEVAKVAFVNGIWNYVMKMNRALREYSYSRPIRSTSCATIQKLIKMVPPDFEINGETDKKEVAGRVGRMFGQKKMACASKKKSLSSSKNWIKNGFLVLGGIFCLSRGRSAICSHLAVVCILKKFMK